MKKRKKDNFADVTKKYTLTPNNFSPSCNASKTVRTICLAVTSGTASETIREGQNLGSIYKMPFLAASSLNSRVTLLIAFRSPLKIRKMYVF